MCTNIDLIWVGFGLVFAYRCDVMLCEQTCRRITRTTRSPGITINASALDACVPLFGEPDMEGQRFE